MPPPPTTLKKIQAIVDFVEDPCAAPWTVYLELARAPAREALMSLMTFGLDDIFRGFFRPKGIYRRARTGRRRRGPRGVGLIPELGEMIGANLPGAEKMQGRAFGSATKFFWQLDGVLQRALFWWMVVDVATDFLYDWSSLINRTAFCQADGLCGAASCDVITHTLVPASLNPQGLTMGCDNIRKRWGALSNWPVMRFTAPVTFTGAAIRARSLTLTPMGALNVWVANAATPGVPIGDVTTIPAPEPFREYDAVHTMRLKPGPLYVIRANCGGPGFGIVTGGHLFGFA
jgi:hypothetical protein